jgi:acetylornithine deacetylase/succinyl-diaminopimelate desuccinylase-like protein
MQAVYEWIDSHKKELLADLFELLELPSISAQNLFLRETAEVVHRQVTEAGFNADVMPVRGGPPVVFSHIPGSSERTLLCYAHYDVQPAAAELWDSPPFEPTIRDDVIYGRGATDNKSGLLAFVKAAQAFRAVRGKPPVSLKLVFEGEEEVGSRHFVPWVEEHAELLACDASFCLDGPADHSTDIPAIQLGVKAILYVELRLKLNEKDLWSGFAGWAPNPVWRMIQLLNTLLDPESGEILIEGWYDEMAPISAEDEELLAAQYERFDAQKTQKELGITEWAWGMDTKEALRRRHYLPTCNLCGITAGYTGEGSKTIIPSGITVKLDFRCPPNLEPQRQLSKLRAHLEEKGFGDVELVVHSVRPHPYRVSPEEPISRAVTRAATRVFGAVPPVYGVSIQGLIMIHVPHPAVLSGFALPDCRLHAPNENMPVDRFLQGIKYAATVMHEFAREEADTP